MKAASSIQHISTPPSTAFESETTRKDPLSFNTHVDPSTAPSVWYCRLCPASPLVPCDHTGAIAIVIFGEHPIGYGGFSDVWQAKVTICSRQTLMVALKVLRPMNSDPDRLCKRLKREILCWGMLHHANIAPFYGIVYQAIGSPGLVSPWYDNGSVDLYLQRHPDIMPLQILWEITLGIEYLHELGIVHGDLKGANVMIDDEGHAKLIDFGLSRLIDSDASLTTCTTSSIRWCAPELLCSDDAQVTKSSDVYAFASTALQLLTGDVPYSKVSGRAVYRSVSSEVNPRTLSSPLIYDISGSEYLWRVLEKCWMEAPLRPTISQVKRCIRFVCL